MEITVSVVVPVYNVKEYLIDCLNSIKNQTYASMEIILVDDGSTDGSAQICDEFEQEDERISVIHKKNGGLSEARNVGLNASKGEYIIFIDSDDLISEKMLEEMVKCIKISNIDIVACAFKTFEDINEVSYIENSNNDISMVEGRELVQRLYKGEYNSIGFTAWNKLYKKSLFQKNGIEYPVGRFYEDAFTTFKLLYKAKQIALINKPLYYYRMRNGSIMNSNITRKKTVDGIDADREAPDFFKKVNDSYLFNLSVNAFFKSEILFFKRMNTDTEKGCKEYLLQEYKRFYKEYGKTVKIPSYKRLLYCMFMLMPNLITKFYR